LTRADLIELVEGLIGDGKQTLANRVHALCSQIGSFAVDAGLLNGNPSKATIRRGGRCTPSMTAAREKREERREKREERREKREERREKREEQRLGDAGRDGCLFNSGPITWATNHLELVIEDWMLNTTGPSWYQRKKKCRGIAAMTIAYTLDSFRVAPCRRRVYQQETLPSMVQCEIELDSSTAWVMISDLCSATRTFEDASDRSRVGGPQAVRAMPPVTPMQERSPALSDPRGRGFITQMLHCH
jgi:hypothetical protein